MKKLFAVFLSACMLAAGAVLFSACDDGRMQVSVLQYAEHGSLDNCYDGIVAGLAERGYTEENMSISLHNARGNDSDNTTAAHTIINSMPDVAVGIATPSAYALATAANGDVPVVFTAVSDPEAETANFSLFENVTGSSDQLPVSRQLQLIRDFFDAKGQEGQVTGLGGRDPAQFLAFPGAGRAVEGGDVEEVQLHVQVTLGVVVLHDLPEPAGAHADAQFLAQFAAKGLFGGLAGFELAAGELPVTGHGLALRAQGGQQVVVLPDDAAGHDDGDHARSPMLSMSARLASMAAICSSRAAMSSIRRSVRSRSSLKRLSSSVERAPSA